MQWINRVLWQIVEKVVSFYHSLVSRAGIRFLSRSRVDRFVGEKSCAELRRAYSCSTSCLSHVLRERDLGDSAKCCWYGRLATGCLRRDDQQIPCVY